MRPRSADLSSFLAFGASAMRYPRSIASLIGIVVSLAFVFTVTHPSPLGIATISSLEYLRFFLLRSVSTAVDDVPTPMAEVPPKAAKSKKSSFMSASIPAMSVGDVRKCLNEIRRLGPEATSAHVLATNGWTAGEFALKYLWGIIRRRRARRRTRKIVSAN
eukprot:jgi/Mesvir1/9538/Mv08963-RA.1